MERLALRRVQACAHANARHKVCILYTALFLYRLDGSRDLLPSWYTCTLYNHMKSLWKIRFVRHSGLYILTM